MTDLIAEQIDAEIQPEAATSDARRHRLPRLLALLPGAGVGAAMIWTSGILTPSGRVFTLVDDALISMSYARTLVETGEFVWFPGAPKVEGITNPLWALIMTIPQALGLSDSASCLVMSLVGLGCVLGAAFLAGGLAVRMLDPGRAGGTAGAVAAGLTTATVGLGWPLLFWSVFGLEVGFVAMLTVAAIALAVRSAARDLSARSLFAVGGVLAIGLLTRPDFAVVAGAVGLWAVALPARFVAPPSQALAVPPRWQRAAAVWSLPVLAAILLTIARLTYYGAVLPNTYTLKMSGSSALERIGRSWSIHHELLIWGILTAAAAVLLARRTGVAQRLAVILVVGTAALLAAYALYSGGDAFRPDRFTASAWMLGTTLLVTAAVRAAGDRTALGITAAGLAGLLALGLSSLDGYRDWVATGAALPKLDDVGYRDSYTLADVTSPDAVIAVYGAGAPVYWGHLAAIDLLGKVDPAIAGGPRKRPTPLPGHDKWDYTHSIIEGQPDIVLADLLSPNSLQALYFPASAAETAQIAATYDRICVGETVILVRKDSTKVDRTKLVACPVS